MQVFKVNNYSKYLIISLGVIFLLFLSLVNLYTPKPTNTQVLGLETNFSLLNEKYWKEFLDKNPSYISGWLEIGRTDVANEIDPNYIKP